MAEAVRRPENRFDAYHAHVYFDADTVEHARTLCSEAWQRFHVQLGRMHQKALGPHPRWSCQIAFDAEQFDALIPWLDERREGLTVLVHARTGDDLADHTEFAAWLGDPVELRTEIFEPKSDEG